jgi:AraC family ethanolamine operon transcriptional activator
MALARQHTRWVCVTFSDKALKRLNELNLDSALQRFETNHQVLQCDPVNSRAIADHCMKLVEFFRKGVLQDGLNKNQRDDLLVSINSALAGPENKPTRNLLRQYKMVKQAREFMLDRKSDPPTIVDICDALSVPERTLHNAFQRVYGVSPKRFLTAQRLLAARRKLRESGATQTVSDVAASLGFLEFGRFSMVYRAMFGELPSETRV